MADPRTMNPAVLSDGKILAILSGYFIAAATAVGFMIAIERFRIHWLQNAPWAIVLGLFLAPVLTFSVLAARKHRNYAIACLGSLAGNALASITVVCIAAFTEPDDEFGPPAIIMIVSPSACGLTWMPSMLVGVIAVRIRRGSWKRLSTGKCFNCGYDLSGLRGSICPECGADSAKPAANHPN